MALNTACEAACYALALGMALGGAVSALVFLIAAGQVWQRGYDAAMAAVERRASFRAGQRERRKQDAVEFANLMRGVGEHAEN